MLERRLFRPQSRTSIIGEHLVLVFVAELTEADHEGGVYPVPGVGGCVTLDAVVGPQVALVYFVIIFARERLEHLQRRIGKQC